MRYQQRNGDKEMPLVEGLYWFMGVVKEDKRIVPQRGMLHVMGTYVCHAIHGPCVGDHGDLDKLDGFWWGPIVAPWEWDG